MLSFCKNSKKNSFFLEGGSGPGGGDGCEQRIEVLVKIKKKKKWGVL